MSDAPEAASAPGPSKVPLILALANTLAIAGALGLLVYSKLMFKRPPITEEGERVRLNQAQAARVSNYVPGSVHFDAFTVNIKSSAPDYKPTDGALPPGDPGKLHYATIEFSMDIRDESRKAEIETLRPILMDKILSMLGRKDAHELTTVQGRYLLRTQIQDLVNQRLAEVSHSNEPAVTNVYFTQFVVQ